ncbi:MAG TPA: histidine phosphotransferase family protein [Hyphomonadaceae bacterium]|nr:histidine phosphotransferase family protein [Hyphomonadaceae bacterium]HPI47938.1 histidine phosphotransferase family protein [Hyphomonadaceae bacterium]
MAVMESSKLAAYVASRICHDVASPLTSLLQSCELLFDDSMGPAMKAEGEKSLRTGLATLEAKLRYMRYALGSQALNDNLCSIGEAKDLFEKLFATNSRTKLDWQVETHRISNRQMRILMNMTLIMIDPAARGVCRVSATEKGGKLVFDVEALGQFSNFKSEVLDALAGKEPGGGWGGGAVQPFFTRVLCEESGFTLEPRIVPQAAGLTAIGALPEG